MNQLLLRINFWESKQLEYWLTDNYSDCTIRCMYDDSFMPPEQEDLYAIEGTIVPELECLIKLKYGDKVKSGVRFGNIENI